MPLSLLMLLVTAPSPYVDDLIPFGAERHALTLSYRRAHSDPDAANTTITPRVIVIHHTATRTYGAAHRLFTRTEISGSRKRTARAGRVNVSAHFLVDRDGSTARLVPETVMARHCIGLNHVAIGIENVGGLEGSPLTTAQLEANARLIRHLVARFKITHVIGHFEVARFEAHPYFVERDSKYRSVKIDPGKPFMKALRSRIRDLGLRGP